MDNAADGTSAINGSNRAEQSLNYTFTDARPAEYNFQSTSRQSGQDPTLLSDFGRPPHWPSTVYGTLTRFSSPDRSSYGSESSRQSLRTLNTAPTRLSLVPQNIYTRLDGELRVLSNADSHFRFAKNLRQGLPVNRVPPPQPTNNFFNHQAPSPITQLANNMLLQKPMPQASPEVNLFHGLNPNRLNQLQPRRQEITPPFNLSEYLALFFPSSC